MTDTIKRIEASLEETTVDFAIEELEVVVTPGYGFGCACS